MKYLRTLLVAACASVAFSADAPPKLRLEERQDIAPTGYRAELTLDPAKDTFQGSISIRAAIRKPVQTIWLNANKIQVREASLTAGGKRLQAKAIEGGDDFLGLQFDAPVPTGAVEIKIDYSGKVQSETSGIFHLEDRGSRYILTQFESTDARRAFPCVDEPGSKVPWQLTLHVPAGDVAVSNTPIVSESTAGGTRTYVFKETKPLPSYLIAFGVGPFEFVNAGVAGKNRIPVRIVTPKGRANEAKYAAEVTAEILTRLEEYFGIPFPYEKSDQVSVPVTLGFGAMENAGMVTYGQNIILADPAKDTLSRQRSYATVAAHELAHQWFGDLVTMQWWNDVWLNEAFASWMEQKLVAEWKPEWKTRVEDVATKLSAETADSLVTARKIRQAIETKDDIENAFDGITYNKGAAVIGMFESWMGPAEFRKGVQAYLKQYSFRNATSGEFLDSLSSTSKKDITKAFSTFLEQPGVPVVSVALECKPNAPTLHLEQSRLLPLGSKGSTNQVWELPVCVRYGDGANDRECVRMSQQKVDWQLQTKSCPAWIQANADAKGYYSVDYQGKLLASLVEGNVAARLNAAERLDLMGNTQAMTRAGRLSAAATLGLVETFHNDSERDVVLRALALAQSPRADVVPDELLPNYRRFLLKNFQARAHQLGWVPRPGEPDDVRLLRPALLPVVATDGGDEELAKEARELADKWFQDRKSVNPDVVGAVLSTAGYYSDVALYSRFLAEFKKTTDRQEQQRLINAMISSRDPKALELGMQAVLKGDISLSNGFALITAAGQYSRETRKLPFEFVKAHFDQLMTGHPSIFGFDLGGILPRVGQSFCDADSRNELQSFFGPIADKYSGAPRTLAQAVEGINLCIARKEAQRPSVAEFLKTY